MRKFRKLGSQMSHFHKALFCVCLINAKCFGAFASLHDTRFRGLFREVLQPYLAYVAWVTVMSEGPISAILMSVKISWFICQSRGNKSPVFSYFWIYFEDQMTICTFLMIPACIWTIFGTCTRENHIGKEGQRSLINELSIESTIEWRDPNSMKYGLFGLTDLKNGMLFLFHDPSWPLWWF